MIDHHRVDTAVVHCLIQQERQFGIDTLQTRTWIVISPGHDYPVSPSHDDAISTGHHNPVGAGHHNSGDTGKSKIVRSH